MYFLIPEALECLYHTSLVCTSHYDKSKSENTKTSVNVYFLFFSSQNRQTLTELWLHSTSELRRIVTIACLTIKHVYTTSLSLIAYILDACTESANSMFLHCTWFNRAYPFLLQSPAWLWAINTCTLRGGSIIFTGSKPWSVTEKKGTQFYSILSYDATDTFKFYHHDGNIFKWFIPLFLIYLNI